MEHAMDVFRFVLAFKSLIINDLQPLPYTMSTVRCGQWCHEDKTCISFFHDVNTRQCYSYSSIINKTSTILKKLDGIMYYLNSKDGLCGNYSHLEQKRLERTSMKKTLSGETGIRNQTLRANLCRDKGFTYWYQGDICYKKMPLKQQRHYADKVCLNLRGGLFDINSEQQHLFFVKVVAKELNHAKCYTSGIRNDCRITCGGPWSWDNKFDIEDSKTRWHPGCPCSQLAKNCIAYTWKHGKYLWEEVACFGYQRYYCEIFLD